MLYDHSKKCESPFSFQKMNKYFLLPFFVPIFCFSTKFFSEPMKTNNEKIDIKNVTLDSSHTFSFLYILIQGISMTIGGLLYFISRRISKSEKVDENNGDIHSQESKYLKTLIYKKPVKKNIKLILIIALMPLLYICYLLGIAYGIKHPQLEKRVYYLLAFTLINIFYFKKEIFLHQKVSLCITFIGVIPIYISFGLFLVKDSYNIIYDIFLLIGTLINSIYLLLIKYITEKKGVSVFLLLLYQGILIFFYTLIIFSIISLISRKDLSYIGNIFYCDETNYICISNFYFEIIMFIILNTVLHVLIFSVIDIFSAELLIVSDYFSPLFSFIANSIKNSESNNAKIILNIFGYLIIVIGALIYDEIIICNFLGLNKNTWKAIDKKAEEDAKGIGSRDSLLNNDDYDINSYIPNDEMKNINKTEMTDL